MPICSSCFKNKQQIDFPQTTGYLWPAGHVNLCFACTEKLIDPENLNEVDRWCQFCNFAFYPDEWRKIYKREGKKAFSLYAQKYVDINYLKYDWGQQNKMLMQKAEMGLATMELEELRPYAVEELKTKWGELPESILVRLERYYCAALADYNVSTEIQRDDLRKLARLSIMIDEDFARGVIDKDKTAAFDKMQQSLLKNLETSKGDAITAVGEICAFIEQNGYRATFYDGIVRDEYDAIMQNMQEYTRDLVLGETRLTELVEATAKVLVPQKEKTLEEELAELDAEEEQWAQYSQDEDDDDEVDLEDEEDGELDAED